MPASHLVKRHSPHCSAYVFQRLEESLLTFRDPEERRRALFWIAQKRFGDYGDRIGGAHLHLLPALCQRRRSLKTTSLIGCLREKFNGVSPDVFLQPRASGGWVRSPIAHERIDRLSDSAWLRIIGNRRIPRRGGAWKTTKHFKDCVVETSVETFASDFRTAAMRNPERFGLLALKFPAESGSDYLAAVLSALGTTKSPTEVPDARKDEWVPASAVTVETLLERVNLVKSRRVAMEVCWLLIHRDDIRVSERIVETLLDYSQPDDPAPEELHVGCDKVASECSVEDLETNAINCVRGVAAHAIASLLYRDGTLLSRFRDVIESLINDSSPVVRTAAISICLPIWNIDQGLATKMLATACRDDERIGACHDSSRLYNHAFPEYHELLAPLIRRLSESERSDVAAAGAAQITARHLFYGSFAGDLEKCVRGTAPQRRGVARVAAQLSANAEHYLVCERLLVPLFDDDDADVRNAASGALFGHHVFEESRGLALVSQYAKSKAFIDDPNRLLHQIEQHTGPIVVLADLILGVCEKFTDELRHLKESNTRGAFAGSMLSPLLLRLYEQSASNKEIQQRCLDTWDRMMAE
jgi:hypothetical protein